MPRPSPDLLHALRLRVGRGIAALAVLGLTLVLAACGGGGGGGGSSSNTVNVALPPVSAANTIPLTVSYVSNDPNILYATVTVCDASGGNCHPIDHIIVDTGSTGLRLLASAVPSSTLNALQAIQPQAGQTLGECALFASGYLWGGMRLAKVQLGALTTTQAVPVQIVGDTNVPSSAPSSCTGGSGGGAFHHGSTLTNMAGNLQGNGILGIGNFLNDCGSTCTSTLTRYYDLCTASSCSTETTASTSTVSGGVVSSVGQQGLNPVAALGAGYNDGVVIAMPTVPSSGATTASGYLYIGAAASASQLASGYQTYALDSSGNLGVAVSVSGSQVSTGSGFIDSGSNGYFLSNSSIPALTTCSSPYSGFYCPSSPVNLGLQITPGYGSTGSASASATISDAATQLATSFAALPQLGGTAAISGEVDLGMPFFYGRSIAVGIEQLSGSNAPYGYDAF